MEALGTFFFCREKFPGIVASDIKSCFYDIGDKEKMFS
jgi:hypothetical protein